ncbi:MAG: hypothetical protein ACYSUI_25665, partial [Planctomycetota bacterium]
FSPELVRLFLSEACSEGVAGRRTRPLLDPFVGCGTFAVECACRGIPALGVEVLASLAFVALAKSAVQAPSLPDLTGCRTWQQVAEKLELSIHRAALICAVARRHTSDGRATKNAPPLADVLNDVVDMMRQDVRRPLTAALRIRQGDARRLESVGDASIGGILTSPPYLSRHDYTRATRPHETVYRFWYPAGDLTARRNDQIRAHPKAYTQRWTQTMPPAVIEACQALLAAGEGKLAGVVRSYFEDMFTCLGECRRVLADGAPCWIVVGGARLKGVYVPSDLILAEHAASCGFEVADLRVARRLIPTGRKLGGLAEVSPRETVLVLANKNKAS